MATRLIGLAALVCRLGTSWTRAVTTAVAALGCLLLAAPASADGDVRRPPWPGVHVDPLPRRGGTPSAGTVTVVDQLALLELAPEALLPANLLDLEGRTVRFTPDGSGYTVETVPLVWDGSFGSIVNGFPSVEYATSGFAFPFAGRAWTSIFVNAYGCLSFGASQDAFFDPTGDRFLLFRDFGRSLDGEVPIIALFRRLGGAYGFEIDPLDVNRTYVKEGADRLVVTWLVSEPYFELQTFTSWPRVNRFQIVLHDDGVIELSYLDLQVEDGIVGVFTAAGAPHRFPVPDPVDDGLPAHIDVLEVTAVLESPDVIRVTFEMRGDLLPEGDPTIASLFYRMWVDLDEPFITGVDFVDPEFVWGIGTTPGLTYEGTGPGVSTDVEIDGNRVTLRASTDALGGAEQFAFFIDVVDFDDPGFPFDQTAARTATRPEFVHLATLPDAVDAGLPAHIDVIEVTANAVSDQAVQFVFSMRGDILPAGDPEIASLYYRVFVDLEAPFPPGVDFDDADLSWEIGATAELRYHTTGPSVHPDVVIDGSTIALTAALGPLAGLDEVAFFVDVVDFDDPDFPFDQAGTVTFPVPPTAPAITDLSEEVGTAPARATIYEPFHYHDIPDPRDLACTVIDALGDEFDFFCFFTDFRIDRQEAGAVSTGPIGNLVTGIHPTLSQPDEYCSDGRLQCCQYPLFIGSPIAAESGADLSGPYTGYNRQVALVSHELGHRWLSTSRAIVGGEEITIGTVHWVQGLHAPVAFPIEEPYEASMMAGNHWQDNGDGTFTSLTQPFFQSAGYSYLDLYLMGLLPQNAVPDFFLIEDLQYIGRDPEGRPVYTGSRLDITVEDEIAAHGLRLPLFEDAQRAFNTGLVGIVMPGAPPSPMLLERTSGIRAQWTAFWPIATGGVSTMCADAVTCRADLDGNGAVDVADIIRLLSAWGQTGGPEDLSGNGIVDVADIIVLLSAWGPCPA